MIDRDKIYTLDELINKMYNLDFKYYGNNDNGKLEVYVKTDVDIMSVFSSLNDGMTKKEYLKLNEEEARELKFIFDREVKEMDLDIVAIVLRTSDVNIPSTRYSLETLDKLTKEQDQEDRKTKGKNKDGICYLIVDNNTACTLYDGVYTFDKNNNGLIEDLKEKLESEENEMLKGNLQLILNYIEEMKDKNSVTL